MIGSISHSSSMTESQFNKAIELGLWGEFVGEEI
jgi:hypothetical protein